MTPPSESSPVSSPDPNAPFASLYPVLQGINQAIYAFWKIPLPEGEPLTNPPPNSIESVTSPKIVPAVEQPTIPDRPPSDALQVLPTPPITPSTTPSLSPSVAPVETIKFHKSQTFQRIARLGKMHWSKPKATNYGGRRRVKRCQGN